VSSKSKDFSCPSCGSRGVSVFYELEQVPVHSVLLIPTRKAAIDYPKGDIKLAFCQNCGFITNIAFDPNIQEFSERYEETQGFSPTFNKFSRQLAMDLIEKHDLRSKDIIEIGCGKGEFLTVLCELGGNRGIGFDPSYVEGRLRIGSDVEVSFIKDFYSEEYADYNADFICCKMTLEHIDEVAEFVRMVKRTIENNPDAVVFFQVPDVTRILYEVAFWDIYYEHCSYFSPGSLARLFRSCGFSILDLWKDYGDQYIMIEASVNSRSSNPTIDLEDDISLLSQGINHFLDNNKQIQSTWRLFLRQERESNRKVVLWGSGSKAVAFLTTLNVQDDIKYTVDINPYKQGMFIPGTGQEIVSQDFLREYQPNVAILMNPIYRSEVQNTLDNMDLTTELLTV
jgi:SAM-dependent methyltransferase